MFTFLMLSSSRMLSTCVRVVTKLSHQMYSRLIDSNSIWSFRITPLALSSHFPTPFANHHGWQMNQSFMLLLATLQQHMRRSSSKTLNQGILNRKCDLRRPFLGPFLSEKIASFYLHKVVHLYLCM